MTPCAGNALYHAREQILTPVHWWQAFRHLYVLAAVPRCVDAVDVSTGQSVHMPLRVTLKVRC